MKRLLYFRTRSRRLGWWVTWFCAPGTDTSSLEQFAGREFHCWYLRHIADCFSWTNTLGGDTALFLMLPFRRWPRLKLVLMLDRWISPPITALTAGQHDYQVGEHDPKGYSGVVTHICREYDGYRVYFASGDTRALDTLEIKFESIKFDPKMVDQPSD